MFKIILANQRDEYLWILERIKSSPLVQEAKLIKSMKELDLKKLVDFSPDYIFFTHWSEIIPEKIHSRFNCVIFHMTDLPYGRGGSPFQNLIVRGFSETKVSALRCEKELDSGPIYLKKDLSLNGSAKEVFDRCSHVVFEMILQILKENPEPVEQEGRVSYFRRRKPNESDISKLSGLKEIYDYIRMMDADGYPRAFLETTNLRIEFDSAELIGNEVKANVRIKLRN